MWIDSLSENRLQIHSFVKRGFVFAMMLCYILNGRAQSSDSLALAYQKADARALNVPASATRSVETLASALTDSLDGERLKTRALFRWMTEHIAYDVEGYRMGGRGMDFTPAAVLKRRKSVCEGYAQLFNALCIAAKLETAIVRGFSKGYGYAYGKKFTRPDHAWNAVKIDGKWELIDVTWGAGLINAESRFEKKFKAFYFCARPQYFIYDHLPEDSKWQLISPIITKETFAIMPTVKFQQEEIGLETPQTGYLTQNDSVTFTVFAPKAINALIIQNGGKNPEDVVKMVPLNGARFTGRAKISHKKVQIFGQYPNVEFFDELIEFTTK